MFQGREYLFSDEKYLKLDIAIPHDKMLEEAKNLRDKFITYRSDAADNCWHSLPLVALDSDKPYSWNVYGFKDAKEAAPYMKYTELSDLCPVTTEWLKNYYPSNSYARVRYMLLDAGGKINFHKDTDHSAIAAINIALNNPRNCKWHWKDGETLEFCPGDVYAMNLSHEHAVYNDSDEDRFHMIVHHYDFLPECKDLFIRSMEEQDVKGSFVFSTELF